MAASRPGCLASASRAIASCDREGLSGEAIVQHAEAGEERAAATLSRYEDRLARALAHVINLLDPDVIVLGGGVSRVERLYRTVPALWDQWVFWIASTPSSCRHCTGTPAACGAQAFLCPGMQHRHRY